MKRFFISVITMFQSCFFPDEQIECSGFQLQPYTGNPIENIKRMSAEHSKLPTSKVRVRIITGNLIQPDINTPSTINPWELINKRGVDIISQQTQGNLPKGRIFQGRDGLCAILTKGSLRHLTEKHAYQVGINDLLPVDQSKPLKYPSEGLKTRTQGKKGALNQLAFGDKIQRIIEAPDTQIFPTVDIRGIKGHGYFTTRNYGPENELYGGFFIGVHTEGELSGRIMKAQPLSHSQVKKLIQFDKITD